MTEDDIMLMAQKAGPLTQGPFKAWCKRFANLVAAAKAEVALAEAYRCGYEAGAAAEREACAKVVDAAKAGEEDWDSNDWNQAVEFCASRIRARNQA